jgi:putative FmdB family regulatory protein
MPLYPYICNDCGDFQTWRSMAACDQPAPCPRCGTPSRRAVAAPRILGMDEHTRIAHMRNEKSAHEPRVVRKEHAHDGYAHGHDRHAHGRHLHAPRAADRLEPHLHQSARRTMIGH